MTAPTNGRHPGSIGRQYTRTEFARLKPQEQHDAREALIGHYAQREREHREDDIDTALGKPTFAGALLIAVTAAAVLWALGYATVQWALGVIGGAL